MRASNSNWLSEHALRVTWPRTQELRLRRDLVHEELELADGNAARPTRAGLRHEELHREQAHHVERVGHAARRILERGPERAGEARRHERHVEDVLRVDVLEGRKHDGGAGGVAAHDAAHLQDQVQGLFEDVDRVVVKGERASAVGVLHEALPFAVVAAARCLHDEGEGNSAATRAASAFPRATSKDACGSAFAAKWAFSRARSCAVAKTRSDGQSRVVSASARRPR